ncbi:MAG: hypothetical protein ABFD25_00895 [Clostridiaceae bacterium]
MKSNKHYWKITFTVLTAHVSGLQKIKVQNQRMSEWKDIVFEGTLAELEKRENRRLRDTLEFELIGTIAADGETLIIGINS